MRLVIRTLLQAYTGLTAFEILPLTVGGGIRSVEDGRKLLQSGADKICVNTATVLNPVLISEMAEAFGQQAVVIGIEAKKFGKNWIAMTHNGRERTELDVIELASKLMGLGAGEIFLTSIDAEGTQKGFDVELIKQVRSVTKLSVIAHGGMGSLNDALEAHHAGADGIAIASVLHWDKFSLANIKAHLSSHGVHVRETI
jgi:cyclase